VATLEWHQDRADNPALTTLDDLTPRQVDLAAVRRYRLGRVRAEMAARSIDACLLFDPVNVRYATGARNMQVFHLRNPSRYLFLPGDGPVILFEFTGAEHLGKGLETIDEVRPAITASYVAAGPDIAEIEQHWARETAALVREQCGVGARVGVERINARAALALQGEGFDVVDAQEPVERARAIKSSDELELIKASLRATERGVHALRRALRPGLTENELWSVLYAEVIAQGGDYIETRLLTSGTSTNPWFQEASERRIRRNELVALDTDVVGCHGYYADFSRTFHAGPDAPTTEQQTLYRAAYEQVHHNMAIIEPGMRFSEYAARAWSIPDPFVENRYYLSAHGVGMTGEYPYLYHSMDYPTSGYDGAIEPMMTLCVESFIGRAGGREGVKLEEQLLVTETGVELLSHFPFEADLLGSNVVPIASSPSAPLQPASPANADLVDRVVDRVLDHLPSSDPCGGDGACAARAPDDVRAVVAAGAARVGYRGGLDETPPDLRSRLEYLLTGPDVTASDVESIAARADRFGVAAVCVNPTWVARCSAALSASPTRVVAAVGHPFGAVPVAVKVREAQLVLRDGADEVDLVVGIGPLRAGETEGVREEVERVRVECREAGAILRIVAPVALLEDDQLGLLIDVARRAGVRWLKTSSGLDGQETTSHHVRAVRALANGDAIPPADGPYRIGAPVLIAL